MTKRVDFPFDEVVRTAEEKMAMGFVVHQKFTCEKCGTRQHMDVPNVFYTLGTCERCSYITDLKKTGCNYMAMIGSPPTCPECKQAGFHKSWCKLNHENRKH